MDQFLIESPHTPEECAKAIKEVLAIGYITHFNWGCKSGEHKGWAIIDAESDKEALLVVPSFSRSKARAVKLTKFTPEEIRSMH